MPSFAHCAQSALPGTLPFHFLAGTMLRLQIYLLFHLKLTIIWFNCPKPMDRCIFVGWICCLKSHSTIFQLYMWRLDGGLVNYHQANSPPMEVGKLDMDDSLKQSKPDYNLLVVLWGLVLRCVLPSWGRRLVYVGFSCWSDLGDGVGIAGGVNLGTTTANNMGMLIQYNMCRNINLNQK